MILMELPMNYIIKQMPVSFFFLIDELLTSEREIKNTPGTFDRKLATRSVHRKSKLQRENA